MKKFENKTILITGSSRGIGKAIALLFAKEGGNIIVNHSKSETEANQVVNEIKKWGAKAISIKCDVSSEKDVENMISKAEGIFGGINILVNNAGIAKDIPLLERTSADWKNTLEVNLIGQFLCSKYVAKSMLKNKSGNIINITSTSALYSFSPDIVDYDASKAGIIALTKNLAKSLAPYIRVNAIAPGWINTDINKDLPENFLNNEKNNIYLNKFGEPEGIAKIVSFLASDDSSFINGTVIVADGGHD